MARWKTIVLILAIVLCFAIAGYIDDPEDYGPSEEHLKVHEHVVSPDDSLLHKSYDKWKEGRW